MYKLNFSFSFLLCFNDFYYICTRLNENKFRKIRVRVSKYIIQTNDAYIFCNEGVSTCVMPIILMNSKERKVYLKQN